MNVQGLNSPVRSDTSIYLQPDDFESTLERQKVEEEKQE